MGPFGKATEKSKGVKKGAGQSGNESSNLGRTLQKEPAHVIHTQRLQEKAKKKSEDNGTSASRCKSGDSAAKVEHAGGKGEPKKADRRVIESICCESKLPDQELLEKQEYEIQEHWSSADGLKKGIPVGQVEHFGVWGSKAKGETGKEGAFITCLEQGSDQAVPAQRSWKGGERKLEEKLSTNKSGVPVAQIRTLEMKDSKAASYVAGDKSCLDASSLALPVGLNRIKTRSGPLCEDGSVGKVDVGVSHSQHAQVRHAAGSVDKLDRVFRTHPTALSALAASPSQEMDNMSRSKFYLFNENVQQEGENRSREGIIANSGGRTVESKNMKLQRSSLSPTILASQSQGSRRGSPLRGTSEGIATPVCNNPASSTPSHLVDGARAKSKELHRGSQKTDLILEKKVPCRLASYLDNDCNKTHDTEGASKQLDVIKETESAKFQEVPRVTEGIKKKKWPKDIKSFSHELGPRGGRPYGYARPHSDNDLEELLGALRARFNTAKEEVDGELKVFAADLVEILDKNADSFPEWKEKVEDLLVLAQRCAMMSPSDFRRECEGFVQEIDDKRQELPMGLLKRLHTRMLFILTRCTRLLQFQKETSSVEEGPIHKIQQCLKGVPSIERSWTSTVSKKGKFTFNSRKVLPDFSDRPGKAEASVTTGKASIHDEKHMVLSEKSEILHQSQDLSTDYQTGALLANQSTSSLKPRSLREESSGTGGDSQDWGIRELKFRPGDNSTMKIVQESCDYVQSGKKIDADESQDIVAQTTTPSKHSQRMSWGYWTDSENLIEEPDSVICRICEEEVPTSHLEGHSFFCAMADTYDVQGLSLEERLRILADNLEKIAELNTPKSSQPAAGESPDVVKPLKLTFHDGPDNTSPKLSDFHGKGAESRFDDLCAIDTASMEELRGLSSISFKPHLGPRSEQGVASSSAGSMTPRSALTTPRTSQLDLLWAERSNFTEAEDVSQIMELADIARCVANKSPMEEGAQEYLIACMQDLQDVLGRNKIEALAVDTFGRRIENLLREKYILVCETVDQRKPDLVSKRPEDDIISVDDGFQSLKSTPTHPAYKDRTTIEDFEILKPISRGAFGRVFLARKRTTGDLFAIKVLRKIDMIRKNAVENILAERDILITVCNPFVVRFFYSFTCRDNLYLVMEYLNGGDLYSLLRNMVCLEEHVARVYIAELVLALEYLHSLGVVHRDLKPDNILIAHDGHIKLTDFGLSKVGLINSTDDLSGPAASGTMLMDENIYQATAGYVQQMERRKERSAVGTPDYLAPEILLGTEHGYTADWWSTGIILFECLTGMPPFNAEHPQIIFDNILNRKIPWPSIPEDMSEEAQDLIDKLLIEDPSQRLGSKGAGEVKAHPFFKHINWDTLAQQKAAFVPNPESLDDTSYFTSRHLESHAHSHHDFIDSTDCSSSSASINSLKARLEEGEDDCGDLAEFESSPSVKNTFSNFSFKNLSQLASINYDLLSQTGKDSSKGHSRQSSVS